MNRIQVQCCIGKAVFTWKTQRCKGNFNSNKKQNKNTFSFILNKSILINEMGLDFE